MTRNTSPRDTRRLEYTLYLTETLSNIIAVYAKKHDLLNTPGWKLSKRHSKDNNKWKEATDLELEQIK